MNSFARFLESKVADESYNDILFHLRYPQEDRMDFETYLKVI